MAYRSVFLAAALCLFLAGPAVAQQNKQPNSTLTPNATGSPRGRGNNCIKQAGISQSTLQQRRSIEEKAKSEIQAVCSDSTLTDQQRRDKIREIRSQARSQMEALFTPEQQQALEQCRDQMGGRGGHGGGHGGRKGEGVCNGALGGSGKPDDSGNSKPPQP